MFDEKFNFYLFEINSAPDLKLSSPIRNKLSTNFAVFNFLKYISFLVLFIYKILF